MLKPLEAKSVLVLIFVAAALSLVGGALWVRLVAFAAIMTGTHTLWKRFQATSRELLAASEVYASGARLREETMALVAHDLRNPLNLIMTTAQLFAEIDPPPEDRRRLTDAMQRAGNRMNRLIEDLLDVARVDSGRLTVEPQDVSALVLVRQTIEMFEKPAREKGIALAADRTDPDLYVHADPERIVQALGNLVGNALKFVQPGGNVRIVCCRRRKDALLMVRDSGPGIAPQQLDSLFTKFWQGKANDRRGIGLGLTITRGIVEAHGGSIWAQSALGRGATFCFTLPVATRARSALRERPVPQRQTAINIA